MKKERSFKSKMQSIRAKSYNWIKYNFAFIFRFNKNLIKSIQKSKQTGNMKKFYFILFLYIVLAILIGFGVGTLFNSIKTYYNKSNISEQAVATSTDIIASTTLNSVSTTSILDNKLTATVTPLQIKDNTLVIKQEDLKQDQITISNKQLDKKQTVDSNLNKAQVEKTLETLKVTTASESIVNITLSTTVNATASDIASSTKTAILDSVASITSSTTNLATLTDNIESKSQTSWLDMIKEALSKLKFWSNDKEVAVKELNTFESLHVTDGGKNNTIINVPVNIVVGEKTKSFSSIQKGDHRYFVVNEKQNNSTNTDNVKLIANVYMSYEGDRKRDATLYAKSNLSIYVKDINGKVLKLDNNPKNNASSTDTNKTSTNTLVNGTSSINNASNTNNIDKKDNVKSDTNIKVFEASKGNSVWYIKTLGDWLVVAESDTAHTDTMELFMTNISLK